MICIRLDPWQIDNPERQTGPGHSCASRNYPATNAEHKRTQIHIKFTVSKTYDCSTDML